MDDATDATNDATNDDATNDDATTDWYWDLRRGVAVPADERGPGDHMLGPYRTRGEAENWKATVESRNDTWDEADDEWNRWDDDEQRKR
jgi:hypothetical protein